MNGMKYFRIWAGLLSLIMVINTVSLDLYAAEIMPGADASVDEISAEITESENGIEVNDDVITEDNQNSETDADEAEENEQISDGGDESLGETEIIEDSDENEEIQASDETGEIEDSEEIEVTEESEEIEEGEETEEVIGEETINIESLDGTMGRIIVSEMDSEDPVYTGEPVTLDNMSVYFGGIELRKGIDYTITFKNNIKAYGYYYGEEGFDAAKAPSYTIKGIGNYSGTITDYFIIVPSVLDATNCIVESIHTTENGSVQKLVPAVTFINKNGKPITLKNNVDFECKYPNEEEGAYVKEGSYAVEIKGINNFYSSVYSEIVIAKPAAYLQAAKLTVKAVPAQNINLWKDGIVKPQVTVSDGKTLLVEGVDYEVDYANNEAIGTGIITITGKDAVNAVTKRAYTGTKFVNFKITGTSLSAKTISCVVPASKNYEGEAIVIDDEIVITDNQVADEDKNARALKKDVDYKLAYAANNKAGKATVTITGIGTYTGTVKKTFTILPYDFAADNGKIEVIYDGDCVYSGGSQSDIFEAGFTKGGTKPQVTVKFGEKSLIEGTDYTVKYVNNTKACADSSNAKCPYLIVTGKNGFKGSLKNIKFLIKAKDISECSLSAGDKVYARKEGNYTVNPVVTDIDGKKLVAGTDYSKTFSYQYKNETKLPNGDMREAGDTVEDSDMVPAGAIVTITVSGSGNYTGTVTTDYRMIGTDMAKAAIKINPQYYTGEPVFLSKNDIVITAAGRVLGENEYELTGYKNNVNKGNAEVTILGVGDEVGGSKTVKFVIANRPIDSTIVFNGNGALTGNMKTIALTSSKKFSAQTKYIPACTFKRPGYEFTGWNYEPDGSGDSFCDKDDVYKVLGAPGSDYYPGNYGSYTLYAQWKPVEYHIVYHLAGGDNNPLNTKLSFTADDAFDIYPVEKDQWPLGYQFGGWYKEDAYRTRVSRIMHGTIGDMDLYAKWIPYTYTVKFVPNAPEGKAVNGTMSDEAFSYGVEKELLANKFTVEGYAFTGWSLTGGEAAVAVLSDKQQITENELEIAKENNVSKTVTLYAVWENNFNITFVTNGGLNIPNMVFGYGDKINLPTTTRAGYDFAGWYMDSECKVKAGTLSSKNGQNYVLYAKWTPYRYTIVFDKNDRNATGTMPALSMNVDMSDALRKNTFVNKGFVFDGWNTKPDGSGSKYDDIQVVTNLASEKGAKVILYAQWKETSYSITYFCRRGTLDTTSAEFFENYKYGDTKKLPVPVREGYEFKGWYADEALTKAVKSITASMYGDLYLYDSWVSDKSGDLSTRVFSITIVSDEDFTMKGYVPYTYTYGTTTLLPTGEDAPVRAGYTFGGWYRDPAMKKKISAITAKDNDDVFLYIKWVPKKYKVTFVNNAPEGTAATGKMAAKTLTFGKETAIGKNLFKVKGYAFKGWSDAPDETAVMWEDNAKITGLGDADAISMYAQWEKEEYSITYVNMDSIRNTNRDYYFVDSAFVLADPEVMGNTFLGWYLDKQFKKRITEINPGTTGNLTLYAKWSKNRYTILYNLNDNDGITYKAVLKNDNRTGYITDYRDYADNGYVLPTAIREGFTFGGWSKDKAGKNPVTALFDTPNIDTTVYAKWNPIRYKITYVLNGAESNSGNPSTYIVSKKDLVFKAPVRCGYEFMGWYENADFSGDKVTRIKANTIPGNITLYAKWQIITYTIKFNANGGTGSIKDVTLVGPEEYTMPGTGITKKDCKLVGWNTKADGKGIKYAVGQKVKGIAAHNGDVITLYAMWEDDGSEIYKKMMAMQSKYPEGMKWTNSNIYTWKGGNSAEIPGKGAGCVAFAYILSDAAFGDAPAKRHTKFSNIKVGDIVRMENDQHSVIVLKKEDNVYTVAEGNFNGKIQWGREITQEAMNKANYVITRY